MSMRRARTLRALTAALAVAIAAGGAACARAELVVEGATMGTRFAVRVAQPGAWTEPALRRAVAEVLARVDAEMSTWRSDSEIEAFNRSRETGWLPVSEETARVAGAARDLAVRSGGAFDPTVAPLVRLWGFGAEPAAQLPPLPERVAAARAAVGFEHFQVRAQPPALRKQRPRLELDLSGIAKGYAVDAVAARLSQAGTRHFLVEIGGEIRARGVSGRGEPWRIEIEPPLAGAGGAPATLFLRDAAVATSGPTRNFVVQDGARLAHVFDPRTGEPLLTDLLSVSVVASSAMQADGWATALLVAGPERGFRLAEEQQLAALFVTLRDGRARSRATPGFDALDGKAAAPSEEMRP